MTREEVIKKLKEFSLIDKNIPAYFYNDYEIVLLAVSESWTALDYIPEKYITKRLCDIAVDIFWMAIDHLPEKYKTIDLRLKAIEKGGWIAWTDFPDGQESYEYYKSAVDIDGWVLQYIPEKFITEELCYLAIRRYGTEAINKNIIPEKYRTNKFIILARQIDKLLSFRPISKHDTTFAKLISSMDRTQLSEILKNIDLKELAVAIKYTTKTVREKIFDKVNNKMLLELLMSDTGPVTLNDIFEAQRNVNCKINEILNKSIKE